MQCSNRYPKDAFSIKIYHLSQSISIDYSFMKRFNILFPITDLFHSICMSSIGYCFFHFLIVKPSDNRTLTGVSL